MKCHPAVRATAVCAAAAAMTVTTALASAAPNASAAQARPQAHAKAQAQHGPTRTERRADRRGVVLNSFEARLLSDMNRVRNSHHLAGLTVVPGATDVARHWSWRLARAQTLSHNPYLVKKLAHHGSSSWTEIEENVGYGPVTSPDELFAAYMNSPEHRANILGSDVSFVGIGVVQRGAYAWNTVDFVNQYSRSYGTTQMPADGLSTDAVTPDSTVVLSDGAQRAERFGAGRTAGVSASRVRTARGATRAQFSGRSKTGHGALYFRDALSLRHVTALRFRLGALTRSHAPVRVRIAVRNGWHVATLGTIRVGHSRTVTLAVPAAERRLLNTIEFRVSGRTVSSAAHHVTLTVANLTAVAG